MKREESVPEVDPSLGTRTFRASSSFGVQPYLWEEEAPTRLSWLCNSPFRYQSCESSSPQEGVHVK